MDHLFDFFTVMSWFWLVLSLGVLAIMSTKTVLPTKGWYNKPLIWMIIFTASGATLLLPLFGVS
jgi:hypothetical protein